MSASVMTENSIRKRLDVYRQERLTKLGNGMAEIGKSIIQNVSSPLLPPKNVEDPQDAESSSSDDNIIHVDPEVEIQRQYQTTLLRKVVYVLCFLLWVVLYIIAIEIQFGAIYFIVTTLIFICLNTHSRPKKPGELSPYSVFNPQCKPIDGTLDASQFEREIRYGIGSVR